MSIRDVGSRLVFVTFLLLLSIGVFAAVPLTANALPFISALGLGWSAQSAPSDGELKAVDFVDASRGWAVGYGWNDEDDPALMVGVILATTNGGTTWGVQSPDSAASLSDVCFVDAAHGWAVGSSYDSATHTYSGTILATSNGGATWSAQSSGLPAGSQNHAAGLDGVTFIDASRGWAVGTSGAILATSNGGATWYAQTSGTTMDLSAVAFSDASHGWAVGDSGTIVATSDGGATWAAQSSGEEYQPFFSVDCTDDDHAWAVGQVGLIRSTSNGGATWQSHSIADIDFTLIGVEFFDVSRGWIVGSYGTILATKDGGVTWTAQPCSADQAICDVEFIDAAHGWAVGHGATVLVTTTGGFPPAAAPTVTSFTPTSGPVGTAVTITGTDLSDATAVGFNGTAATFTVNSATQITASVPAGATSGAISVTTPEGTGTSSTSFTVATSPPSDATAPSVTASGAAQGTWHRAAVSVTLTATDAGSGVAAITYVLDGAETTVAAASTLVNVAAAPNARHTLTYHATDVAANSSAEKTLSFTIDTSGPTTAGKATSGRRGRAIALRYKVTDNLSPKATAIRIVVKNSRGRAVKTMKPTARNTAVWYAAKWTPRARGTYRYYVYAKDLAGNAQRKVGSAKVVVR